MPDLSNKAPQQQGVILHAKEQNEDEDRGDLKSDERRALEKNKRLTDTFVAVTLESLGITDPGPVKVFKEREFFLCDNDDQPVYPPVPGHTDEVIWYPKHGIVFVFDSKFGRYPVTRAELNYQLRVYAVQVFDDIGGTKIFPAIRQPYLRPPHDFHSTVYEPSDIPLVRAEILEIIAEAQKKDAPRKPSIDACFFCRARGTPRCPESLQFIKEVNRVKVNQLEPAKLELLGPEMMMAGRVIEAWKERMVWIAGQYPELLKLYEPGKQQYTRSIKDPLAVFDLLLGEGLLGESQVEGLRRFVENVCKVSVPSLAGFIGELKAIDDEKDAMGAMLRMLGEHPHDAEEPIGLIECKPKQRSLIPKPGVGK